MLNDNDNLNIIALQRKYYIEVHSVIITHYIEHIYIYIYIYI